MSSSRDSKSGAIKYEARTSLAVPQRLFPSFLKLISRTAFSRYLRYQASRNEMFRVSLVVAEGRPRRCSHKLSVKIIIIVILYMHDSLTVNGVLKDLLENGDITGTNLLRLDEQKYAIR